MPFLYLVYFMYKCIINFNVFYKKILAAPTRSSSSDSWQVGQQVLEPVQQEEGSFTVLVDRNDTGCGCKCVIDDGEHHVQQQNHNREHKSHEEGWTDDIVCSPHVSKVKLQPEQWRPNYTLTLGMCTDLLVETLIRYADICSHVQ